MVHHVLHTILSEYRRLRLPVPERGSREYQALNAAALRIEQDCEGEKRQAARTASMVGFAVTRGRTRL
jgi:hypothetical protein